MQVDLLESILDDEWALSAEYPDVNENLSGGQRSIADMFHYLTVHFHEHATDIRKAVADI